MSDWQTIDTAPKDGTHILAFRCGYLHGGTAAVVFWSADFEEWLSNAWSNVRGLSHWMPLPDPPQGSLMAPVTSPQPAPATTGTAPGLPPSGETDGPEIAPEAV